jgi:hypothetical protein
MGGDAHAGTTAEDELEGVTRSTLWASLKYSGGEMELQQPILDFLVELSGMAARGGYIGIIRRKTG